MPIPISLGYGNQVGDILISDTKNQRIQVFSDSGVFLRSFGKHIKEPRSLVCDLDGNVFVVDYGENQVHIYTQEILQSVFCSKGSNNGQLMNPNWITLDLEGNLVVADVGNCRLQVFNTNGVWLRSIGPRGPYPGQFQAPVSVDIAFDGDYVVSDRGNNRIQIISPTGQFIRAFGKKGSADGEFSDPWGVHVDVGGKIVVADESTFFPMNSTNNRIENNRIQIFSASGQFLTKIGRSSAEQEKDSLGSPTAVVIGKDGRLVIADTGFHRFLAENEPKQIWDQKNKNKSNFIVKFCEIQ